MVEEYHFFVISKFTVLWQDVHNVIVYEIESDTFYWIELK